MLLAHKKEQDKLEVLAATDNSSELLGYCHEELFDLKNLSEILDERSAQDLVDSFDFIQHNNLLSSGEPAVFSASLSGPSYSKQQFWCVIHASFTGGDILILELEKQRQIENFVPRMNRKEGITPEIHHPKSLGNRN